jgi:lysozyme
MNEKLRALLIKHEGRRNKPYLDSVGKTTIGVGRNLTDKGLSNDEVDYLFANDVGEAMTQAIRVFPGLYLWSENRQNALIDMIFNMGIARFMGFKKMIAALKVNDWATAANEMRHSAWANQLPARVTELASMVEEG